MVPPGSVGFAEAFRTWLKIGCLGFGGPAGQIALMHRILVDEKKWVEEQRYLHALNFCMLLPGPEAQKLATYVGWLLHGVRGGLVAGLLFVLPGLVSIMALSWLYLAYGQAAGGRLDIAHRVRQGARRADFLGVGIGAPGPLDRADVNEHVVAAIVRLNEAVALGCVKPLHGSHAHG